MEQEPKKQMPSIESTLDEQSSYFDVYPEDIRPEYLNNLHLWLNPEYIEQLETYSKTMNIVQPENSRFSKLRNGQTLRQFIDTIQRTSNEINPDVHSLISLYRALRAKGYNHYDLVA